MEDEVEEEETNQEIEEELDEDVLQPEVKATYGVTYKAEFEHKKELSSGSVVCKRHSNDFDLNGYLLKWQRIAGLHATTLGGAAYLVKCSAKCSPGGNITKNNAIPINLRLQSWDDAIQFIDEWSLLGKKSKGMSHVIIEAQYSRLVDGFPEEVGPVHTNIPRKKSSSTTSRALLAAETFLQKREITGGYAADGIFTRWLCNEPSCTNYGMWCFVNPKEKSNGVSKHLIIKQSLFPMWNNYIIKGLGTVEGPRLMLLEK